MTIKIFVAVAALAVGIPVGAAQALTIGTFLVDGDFTIQDGGGARRFSAAGRIDGRLVPGVVPSTGGDFVFSTDIDATLEEPGRGRFDLDAEIPVDRSTLVDALGPWLSAVTQGALSLDLPGADYDRVAAALLDPAFEVVELSNGASFGFGIALDPGAAADDLAGRWRLFAETRDPSVFPDEPFGFGGAFDLTLAIDLAPVPLPAGPPLLLAGLGLLGLAGRRART